MTLQNIRDFVRLSLDVDEEELVDQLLDIYIREGSNRIERASRCFSFYEVDYDIQTIADQQDYLVSGPAGSNASGVTYPLAEVYSVRGPNYSLKPVAHTAARRFFRASQGSTGNPYRWSSWANAIWLWPKPADAITLEIQGYRKPIDWIAQGASAEPDLPEEFHEIICYWALHRGYLQQDDIEMAQVMNQTFDAQVKQASQLYVHGNSAAPFIYGGGMSGVERPYDVARLPFDWE